MTGRVLQCIASECILIYSSKIGFLYIVMKKKYTLKYAYMYIYYTYIFARRSDYYDIVNIPFSRIPKKKYYQNKK
jgi:hypothetical protein